MNSRIDQLLLPKDVENYSVAVQQGGDPRVLADLSTLNFFVGENNSGKSRLLRRMAANDAPRFRPSSYPRNLIKIRREIHDGLRASGNLEWVNDVDGQWQDLEFLPTNFDVNRAKTNLYNSMESYGRQIGESLRSLIRQAKAEFDAYIDSESFRQVAGIPWNRIYLPVLRGLRPVTEDGSGMNDDLYAKRTEKDYFGGKFSGEIYSGLSFYRDLRTLLLGDHAQRKTAREFENFLSTELFGGESVTLIPREGSDVVWFKLGNAQEREIHNMGDGLQHLIILTFPLFKSRYGASQVFIEEPELFLHPGMQRALIKAMRIFEKNQYFIATHSNHFLDLTLEFDDISIYTLHRLKSESDSGDSSVKFEITLVSSHDFRILEMLGARSSSVFLSNCTIWVEGITDRRYLAQYLRLYLDHLEQEEEGAVFFLDRIFIIPLLNIQAGISLTGHFWIKSLIRFWWIDYAQRLC